MIAANASTTGAGAPPAPISTDRRVVPATGGHHDPITPFLPPLLRNISPTTLLVFQRPRMDASDRRDEHDRDFNQRLDYSASRRTSSGIPFRSSLTSVMAHDGHLATHTPHPMQVSRSTVAERLTRTASKGQTCSHALQASQAAAFTCAMQPDEATIGTACLVIAYIPKQQHLQQLHRA